MELVDRLVMDEFFKIIMIFDVFDLVIIKIKFKVLVDIWCSCFFFYVDSN